MEKEIRLRRLYFRSVHRGSKETDLILGNYAACLKDLSDAQLDEYEQFLDESDNDIWDWVSGKWLPEGGKYHLLIAALQKTCTTAS
jgi:antitoxin CptB